MDPQLKSILTTVIGYAATGFATWASTVGIIPAADDGSFANILVSAALWSIAAAIAWYKTRAHTPSAQIAAVNNADNGAKVVAESIPGPRINAPIAPELRTGR